MPKNDEYAVQRIITSYFFWCPRCDASSIAQCHLEWLNGEKSWEPSSNIRRSYMEQFLLNFTPRRFIRHCKKCSIQAKDGGEGWNNVEIQQHYERHGFCCVRKHKVLKKMPRAKILSPYTIPDDDSADSDLDDLSDGEGEEKSNRSSPARSTSNGRIRNLNAENDPPNLDNNEDEVVGETEDEDEMEQQEDEEKKKREDEEKKKRENEEKKKREDEEKKKREDEERKKTEDEEKKKREDEERKKTEDEEKKKREDEEKKRREEEEEKKKRKWEDDMKKRREEEEERARMLHLNMQQNKVPEPTAIRGPFANDGVTVRRRMSRQEMLYDEFYPSNDGLMLQPSAFHNPIQIHQSVQLPPVQLPPLQNFIARLNTANPLLNQLQSTIVRPPPKKRKEMSKEEKRIDNIERRLRFREKLGEYKAKYGNIGNNYPTCSTPSSVVSDLSTATTSSLKDEDEKEKKRRENLDLLNEYKRYKNYEKLNNLLD